MSRQLLPAFILRRPALPSAPRVALFLIFCAGINLILVQWLLVRELTALLLGTEIVTLLVSVAYFAGLSLGYRLANHLRGITGPWLRPAVVITLALHLSLPVWFRWLAALLSEVGAYGAAFVVLPVVAPFAVSLFYSVFLPALVESHQGTLPTLYAAEVIGSGVGILVVVALSAGGVLPVLIGYWVVLMLIVYQLGLRWPMVMLLVVVGAAWLIAFPSMNHWSNNRWYQAIQALPDTARTVFTGYSAYQKVDVLELGDGSRLLFLDGLLHYGDQQGTRLNTFLGQIPAALARPDWALVIGAGSMEMERLIAEHAGHVRTIEIDPLVVEASLLYFDDTNAMSRLPNRSIVIDDAKHYLASEAQTYDLIATDTPAAHTLQTAALYSVPFYRLIAERLNPGGVLAANLTSTFAPGDVVSRRVAASLLAAFDQIIVVTPQSGGWSFAYAGDALPFDSQQIAAALRASGEAQFVIYDTSAVRIIVGDAAPITWDSLGIALTVSVDRIAGRFQSHRP